MNRKEGLIVLIDRLLRRFERPLTMHEIVEEVSKEMGQRVSRDSVRRVLEHIERDLPTGYSIVRQPLMLTESQKGRGGRVVLRYNRMPPLTHLSDEENAMLDNMQLLYQSAANLPWLPEVRKMMEQMNLSDSESTLSQRHLFLSDGTMAALGKKGMSHLGDLFDAALRRYSVSVTYRRFENERRTHEGSVLALKQDDRFWYAAFCTERSVLRAQTEGQWPFFWLAVDRVERVKLSKCPYISTDVDWEDYFGEIIGITNPHDKPVEEVRMLVYGALRDYVVAAPLHCSQRTFSRRDLEGEPVELTLRVKDNHELRNRLSSMMGSVVVTAPLHLAQWQQETLRESWNRINKLQTSGVRG